MKKMLLLLSILSLIYLFNLHLLNFNTSVIYAEELKSITLKLNSKIIPTDVNPIIINGRTLVPLRSISDGLGIPVEWNERQKVAICSSDGIKLEIYINTTIAIVNGKTIMLDSPAKIIDGRTMLPIRFIAEQLNLVVDWNEAKQEINLKNINLESVKILKESNIDTIELSFDAPCIYTLNAVKSEVSESNDKIVAKIPNSYIYKEISSRYVYGDFIRNVSFGTGNNTAIITIDMRNTSIEYQYQAETKGNNLIISFRGSDKISYSSPKIMGDPSIVYCSYNSYDKIIMSVNKFTYSINSQPALNKISIGLSNANTSFDEQKFSIGSNLVNDVQFLKSGENSLVIDINTKIICDFKTTVDATGMLNIIINKKITPITYTNNNDRIAFYLDKVKLTDFEEKITEQFSRSYDFTGKIFKISFSSDIADIDAQKLDINDAYFDSIEVVKDSPSNTTEIIFNSKEKFAYNVITRYNSKGICIDTAITVLKPAKPGETLIVIDPGHGGWEPGAVSSFGELEKNFNLDIAKRLKSLLNPYNIRTYMLREEDIYLSLYERAYIANMLNASCYVSIHNNANDTTFTGTETLYYPDGIFKNGINSELLAKNIQDELLKSIQTENKGLIPRPGLCVLRKTDMPAALAEVAFIDNKNDLELLKNDSFRQKAALGICNGILKTFGMLN